MKPAIQHGHTIHYLEFRHIYNCYWSTPSAGTALLGLLYGCRWFCSIPKKTRPWRWLRLNRWC